MGGRLSGYHSRFARLCFQYPKHSFGIAQSRKHRLSSTRFNASQFEVITMCAMQAHEIDYEIIGGDIQAVEIELDPGETVIAEAGAMNYMEDGIAFEAKMGDGTDANDGMMKKLFGAGKRMLAGESMMITHFTNRGQGKKRVAFAAPYPGKIIPLNLQQLGGTVICQRDGFLCAAFGTKLDIAFTQKLGSGFFGGEGFILQKLTGNGWVFVHACGAIVEKQLRGETLRVDTGCLVGFTPGIDYSIERAGNLKSMIFGGEGLFLATLRGTGTVWLQSLPFSRLANRIISTAATPRSTGSEQAGIMAGIGGLGSMFEQE
jgi:uncharacterized protein (TIGR00266 family)